jgi:hypothetical protein
VGGRHRAGEWSVRDWMILSLALAVGLVVAGFTVDSARSDAGAPAAAAAPVIPVVPLAGATSTVDVVQALPGSAVRVEIDGRTVARDAALGKVVGPLQLTPGSHQVRFVGSGGSATAAATVTVKAGVAHDVVLHAPADAGGAAMVSVYRTPAAPIGAGKARVLLAHTAEVGAGDIWVDGKATFTDITNGQFAQADVPAGTHTVAIRPAGQKGKPILGPLKVDLAEGTVTLAYAVGNPADKPMTVVAHVVRLAPDGSVTPQQIHTGSAGLAADLPVRGFGALPGHVHR